MDCYSSILRLRFIFDFTLTLSYMLLQGKLSQVQQLQRDILCLFPSYRYSKPARSKRDASLGFIGTSSHWA